MGLVGLQADGLGHLLCPPNPEAITQGFLPCPQLQQGLCGVCRQTEEELQDCSEQGRSTAAPSQCCTWM